MKYSYKKFDEPWRLEDLPKRDRLELLDSGIERGKIYIGDPGLDCEATRCPLCKTVIWSSFRCRHLLFFYDWTNRVYEEIDPALQEYFTTKWVPKNQAGLGVFQRERVESALKEDTLPYPRNLASMIPDIRLFESYDISGNMGEIWGFGTVKLLRKLGKSKLSEKGKGCEKR